MKKVLALVLTLAMLVGSLAVGLSAAFEFTATENGDKFENVYSIPLGSGNAAKVTYLQIDNCSGIARNFWLDLWFENEDGFIGTSDKNASYGSDIRPVITISEIGLLVNGEKHTLPYNFEVGQKYEIVIRTGGAEAGKTNVIVNGTTIGAVDGQMKDGLMYTGALGVIMDNVRMTDGEGTQFERDFDGTEQGGGSASGDTVTAFEYRHDLGKYYANINGITCKAQDNWKESADKYSIEFDFRLPNTAAELSAGNGTNKGPYIADGKIGVGQNNAVDYSFEIDEWYHALFSVEGDKTLIYVNGVKVEGNFPAMGDAITDAYAQWWSTGISLDNVRFGNMPVMDFETDKDYFDYVNDNVSRAEHVGEKVNIFDKISTYPVEGEATLIEAVRNDAKDPSKDNNALYTTTSHTDGAVPKDYIINFDLALYPDKEGTISSDKVQDGAWIEFICNKFGSGDDSRIKVGNKFVGKNKDLVYYGEGNDLQPWAAGEFHNVTIQIANGAATVYIDKAEVYTSPVGMDNWGDLCIYYFDNCNAIIDNYRIYDAKTFEAKVDTLKFGTGDEYVKTLSDVKAENFCETNGHILSWARTTDPKCYEKGVNTYTCYNCDFTEAKTEVATLEHKFQHYDITRVDKETGLVYTQCTTSEGCPERKFIELPDAADYTGNIKLFHDFQDEFVRVTSDSIGFEKIEDGVAKYIESDLNYNQIGFGREYSSSELNAGTKVGFDFSVDGTFDTDASMGQYGHSFDFYFGKSTIGAATIKYNMDTQRFYINSTNKNFGEKETEKTYPLVPGEVYNLEVAFKVDEEAMTAELAVYLNGEEILRMDEFDAYDYITYDSAINCILLHVYGVKINIDNFVIGDYDFGWNRAYAGDVDGDYAITMNDALLMRKYLAKIIDMDALYASRADVNGDGYVDAIDQLRIRKALAD